MLRGAIVLCGGRSTRMGRDKASLPFGPHEVLLQRVVRIAGSVVGESQVVVVAAAGQTLPQLPLETIHAVDRRPALGPLEGIAAGLAALPESVERAFVTSCDVPLLVPEFVRKCFELADASATSEVVVPVETRFAHPLAAVYAKSVLPEIESLLAADRRRPAFLFEARPTLRVPVDTFRDVDPDLRSLQNCNLLAEYRAALKLAGFPDGD